MTLLFVGFIWPAAPKVGQAIDLRAAKDRQTGLSRRTQARTRVLRWGGFEADQAQLPHDPADRATLAALGKQLAAIVASTSATQPQETLIATIDDFARLQAICARGTSVLRAECSALTAYEARRVSKMGDLLKAAQDAREPEKASDEPQNVKEPIPSIVRTVAREAAELPQDCEQVSRERNLPIGIADQGREICRQYSLLRIEAKRADIQRELATLLHSQLSIKFLGLLGLRAEGIDDLQVPLLFIPVVWSSILLGCLIYAIGTRRDVLGLYARAIHARLCVAQPDGRNVETLADDIGGLPQCPYWWLAPLPDVNTQAVGQPQLREALGWRALHPTYRLATTCILLASLACQLTVTWIGMGLAFAFSDGVDARIDGPFVGAGVVPTGRWEVAAVAPILSAISVASLALVVSWLWPWSRIRDEPPTDEDALRSRRATVAILTLGLAGLSLPWLRRRPAIPTAALAAPRKRFRRKHPKALAVAALASGFYLNRSSGVVHYVVARVPGGTWPSDRRSSRRKRRRIALIRLERRHHRDEVASWRVSGRPPRRYPQRARQDRPAPSKPLHPMQAAPARIRHMTQMPRRQLEPIGPLDLFAPFEPQRPPKQKDRMAPHVAMRERVFAFEQEALRLVRRGETVAACGLLKLAIEESTPRDRSMLRVFDTLAIIAVTWRRPEMLEWLIATVEGAQKASRRTAHTSTLVLTAPGRVRVLPSVFQPLRMRVGHGSVTPTGDDLAVAVPEFAQRLRSWKNTGSNWHRRWSRRIHWTGLPT